MTKNSLSANSGTLRLVRAAIIAALYAVLTLAVYPIAYGPLQIRISEALAVLPLFYSEAVVGLTLGCFISNVFGNGILDLLFGTLATLFSATLTLLCGRIKNKVARVGLGILPPIALNALIVPFTYLAMTELKEAYIMGVATVGAGQAIVMVALGIPLFIGINKFFRSTAKEE